MIEHYSRTINYSRHSRVTQSQQATDDFIHEDLLNSVKTMIGLVCCLVSSTDVSFSQILIIYVRYLVEDNYIKS